MTLDEAIAVFKRAYPERYIVKYGKAEDSWIFYSVRDKWYRFLPQRIVETCHFIVRDNKVLPTNPLQFPKNFHYTPIWCNTVRKILYRNKGK